MNQPVRASNDEAVSALRTRVLDELPSQFEVISSLSSAVGAADDASIEQLLSNLGQAAHRMAGRAAMFDLPIVMAIAIEVQKLAEGMARKARGGDDLLSDSQDLAAVVARLRLACDTARTASPSLAHS